MIPRYVTLPTIPDAGLLTRYLDTLGVIVPLARTNLITNPSFETNTTSWSVGGGGGAAIARSATYQYHGAYSLAVTSGGFGASAIYSANLTSGTTYALSMKLLNPFAGRSHRITFETSLGVVLATYAFTSTGRWQWVWLVYQAASTASHQLRAYMDTTVVTNPFYIDGVQLESCADGYNVPTTYLDGDQVGLVPNQFPVPYGWNGTPHASTSYRTGQTRAGGRIVRLRDLGFLLSTIIGLGMAPPQHEALTFAQLDGGQYQTTLKPPRQFSIAGRIAATTPNSADAGLSALARILDRDLVAQRQPLVLTLQAQQCGAECGERVMIPALYSGGLEGQVLESPTQQVPITFQQYIPYVQGHDQGAALTVQQSVSNANAILRRAADGTWGAVGTGTTTGTVFAIAQGLDGTIYAGGLYNDMAGVANTIGIAKWNGSAWSAMGTGGAASTQVNAIAIAPNGDVYVGGSFTLMGGVANTVNIAKWNGSAWSALSTGANGVVTSLAFAPNGTLYVGGSFTTIGGVAASRIASWDGSAFSALTSGTAGTVLAIAIASNSSIYVGGSFASAGGVANTAGIAKWSGSAWSALSTGMTGTSVSALALALNNLLYAGGDFTAMGGVTAASFAVWNGTQWSTVGSAQPFSAGATVSAGGMRRTPTNEIAFGGSMTSAGGITLPDRMARWNGATYLPFDVDLPGTATPFAFFGGLDGSLYVGYNTNGTATAAAITTVTNAGSIDVYPVLTISGPSSGTSRIYQLINTTTGAAIYFNYTINAGETAMLTLNPTNVTFTSTFSGNILNTILPGSNLTSFSLQPGANSISFYAASSTVTAVLQSQIGYNTVNDALYEAITP